MSIYTRFKQGFLIAATGGAASVMLAGAAAAQQCPDWQLGGIQIATDAETAWAAQQYPLFAGGGLNLASCGSVQGVGYVTPAPNFTLEYDARNMGRDLEFRVQTDCDTTLLINDFSGQWHFNDDEDGTLQPRLRLPNAASGRYDIWVGSYGQQACQATLVAETFPPGGSTGGTPPQQPAQPTCPDWSLGGAEVRLSTGAGGDSRQVVAGGGVDLFDNQCGIQAHGYVAQAPDFSLYLDTQGQVTSLDIAVQSECDTTLLVNDPNTSWVFNDDSNGLQPAVQIGDAVEGRYDIWVGTYGQATCDASITFSASGPAAQQPQAPAGK